MATQSRVRGARSPYEVGYGRPPVASRFKKGVSGNPGGRPRSQTLAPDPGPTLGHLVQDAVLKVFAERVMFEVRPGRRQSMPRAEALVRDLCDRAAYDHRTAKLLLEVFGRAHYHQQDLRQKEARAEEARLQRERDEEFRREQALQRAEDEALEQRLQKNLRRRERAAQKRAAQAASERERLQRQAAEVKAAELEAALKALIVEEPSAECAPECPSDMPDGDEDARLYEVARERTLAAAKRSKTGPVTPPEPADWIESGQAPLQIPQVVRREKSPLPVRRPTGPLIEAGQPLTSHAYGLSGTSKPPPR